MKVHSKDVVLLDWVKNIQDDDNITGHYTTDAVSALFTNMFVLEPRTYGLTFAKSF